jgi:hypothetical protein
MDIVIDASASLAVIVGEPERDRMVENDQGPHLGGGRAPSRGKLGTHSHRC